ncbi:MAG: glycosyltransferase family 39 protein [Chitinispirillaceae bacterium]|nr:glycosyltransferase family 39 protein [Chitinispirillaceae bacterium]
MMSGQNLMLLKEKNVRLLIALALLGALFFIPGLGRVHLFDWDEANFAEAAREMLERGDWLNVTIDYQPFYQKPPLFFWLQALSMKVWGVNEFAARFVNAVCGIATLAVVFTAGSRIFGILFGILWALAFFGSFLPHLFFKSGIIDPVFNLLIFSGLVLIAKAFLTEPGKRRTGLYALSGILVGLATLAKGPVALLIVCLTVVVYWALGRFRRLFGLIDAMAFFACAAAVALLFFGVETIAHGTGFIRNFIAYQAALFSTGETGHGGPVYYHVLVLLFGCFPASFFAACSFTKRMEPGDVQRQFSRLMIVLFWVVLVLFSIVKTKTVLYSSLAYFPTTYLAALFLWNVIQGKKHLSRPILVCLSVFAFLVCACITLFPVLIMHKEWIVPYIRDRFAAACLENPVQWSGFEFLLGTGYALALAVSIFLFIRKQPLAGTAGIFGSSALCLFLFLFIVGPKIEQYSQGGPVAFYQSHAGGDVYVRALFKSYTDIFYGRKRIDAHPSSHEIQWLLRGPIDKPAYFVSKITQAKAFDDPSLGLVKLKSEYGFVYYKREVPGNTISK